MSSITRRIARHNDTTWVLVAAFWAGVVVGAWFVRGPW